MPLRKWGDAACGDHKIARLTWQAPSQRDAAPNHHRRAVGADLGRSCFPHEALLPACTTSPLRRSFADPDPPRSQQGYPGKNRGVVFPRNVSPRATFFTPLPPAAGGRGKGEGARCAVCGVAHLTLPGAGAPGPLPLPPKGRRGVIFGELAIAQYTTSTTASGSPDSPAAGGRGKGEGGR
jgi:hypothetical protein